MSLASEILGLQQEDTDAVVASAVHIARKATRGDDHAYARLAALLDARPDGDLVILKTARRLGRSKALAVPLDPKVVEIACRARWLA